MQLTQGRMVPSRWRNSGSFGDRVIGSGQDGKVANGQQDN